MPEGIEMAIVLGFDAALEPLRARAVQSPVCFLAHCGIHRRRAMSETPK
jgi:hypothetical protein